jgi:hypothetical protein
MTDDDKQKMEIAYLGLGRLIAGQCPAGFRKAVLGMEIAEEQSLLRIVSTQQDGTEVQMPPDDRAAHDILESLRGIRKAMAEQDGALWRSCTVTLTAGGGFALDVEY